MSRILALSVLFLTACQASLPVEKEREDEPDRAAEYYAMKREGTDDTHRSYAVARAAMRSMSRYSTETDTLSPRRVFSANAVGDDEPALAPWRFLGPGNIGGRTRVILIDPVEPDVLYAAGVSGGVWRSANAGKTWSAVGDELTNIAVNSMAFDPTDRRTIYAGTGEGYYRESVRGTDLPLRGNGIYVSHDSGDTWTQLPSTANANFHWVNDLAVSTHDPARIYAATRTGVWRSNDSGATWSAVLPVTVRGGCLDLAWRGDTGGDFLFASCGTFEQATIYRSTHAEDDGSWQAVLSDPKMGRTTLAIAPSRPSVIYAMSVANDPNPSVDQGLLAIWRSDSDGQAGSWAARITNASKDDVLGPLLLTNLTTVDDAACGGNAEPALTMGWYCNTIAVDPADPERVWAGGVDLFRSDDGGRTWGQASYWWSAPEETPPFVHADQHVIVFHPRYNGTSNRVAYFGNDGGVFRTDDARAATVKGLDALCVHDLAKTSFTSLNNNYGVTQFYHGAVFPDGERFIAGAQDNGTIIGSAVEGPDSWVRVLGGDGGYVAVDQNAPLNIYAETQGGNVYVSTNGGQTFNRFKLGLSDDFAFIAPFVLDPNTQKTLWLGGRRVWRSFDTQQWEPASTPFPSHVTAIAVAPGNVNRVILGTRAGAIARSDSAGSSSGSTAWATSTPRAGYVSWIAFDPADTSVAYATYSGFGGSHVWVSRDAGATWTALDGEDSGVLPDIPVHSIAVDPTRRDRLYLGTDLGVFVSLDGGRHWAVENTGFTAAVTETVIVAPGIYGPAVYAFTHGRGAWRAELTTKLQPRRRSIRH